MANILYVSSTAVHGGAEEALFEVMTAARELGHRPVLAVPGPGWLPERAASIGVPVEIVPTLPETMATDSWATQFRPWIPTAMHLARVARRHRAALVHSNTPRTAYHGGLAARLAGVRAVTHCYDIIGVPYRNRVRAWMLRVLSDWTLTVSNAVKDTVVGWAPAFDGHVSTLYFGLRPEAGEGVPAADLQALFGVPEGAFVIGNAAAMTPWKGQDVLLEAFRLVHRELPEAHLVLMGGSQGSTRQNSHEAMLHARVRDQGLESRVTFTGWREDWRSLLGAFDVFVHAPTQPDPLPLVVIHGAALGRPIVASAIGGIPEILGNGEAGLLIPPANAPALARALRDLAADPARRRAMGERARARVLSEFSWERMKTTLGEAYDALLRS